MKSETKTKIIIILFIIIFVMSIFLIVNGIVQGGKNRAYKTEINRLEESIVEFGKSNSELDRINAELKNDKQRLDRIITKYGEEIQRLENITNQLRKNSTDAITTIDEIEKLFSEIMDN